MEHEENIAETSAECKQSERVSGKNPRNPAKQILFYLHDIVYFITLAIVILLLCFRVVVVSGDSMKNTLLDGDMLVLLGNTFYRNPQQGDIIVASKDSFRDGEPIIKRVIAVEGQMVDINFATGTVYVDGVALDEPYISSLATNFEGIQFPIHVTEGHIFVLGDNRIRSKDSRSTEIGLIDKRQILGKVIFLLIPGTDEGEAERDLGRIGGLS